MELRTLRRAQLWVLMQINGQDSFSEIQKAEEGVNTACNFSLLLPVFLCQDKVLWVRPEAPDTRPLEAAPGPGCPWCVLSHLGWPSSEALFLSPARDSKNSFWAHKAMYGWSPSSPPSPASPWEPRWKRCYSSLPKQGACKSRGKVHTQRIPAPCKRGPVRRVIISSAILIHFPGRHQCKLCQALQMLWHERGKNQFSSLLFPMYLFLCH